MKNKKDEYERVLIHYCSECISPNIRINTEEGIYQCFDCGNLTVANTYTPLWREKFVEKWGIDYLHISNKKFKELLTLVL